MKTNYQMKCTVIACVTALVLLSGCSDDDKAPEVANYELGGTSVAEWKGYHGDDTFNNGTIAVKSTELYSEEGVIKGGNFEMPLISLINFNLPTDELKTMLITHLQSADFFNMAINPNVLFKINEVTAGTGTLDKQLGTENYTVKGDLTILGNTHEIVFPAFVELTGQEIKTEAILNIDRMKWGLSYASDPALPAPTRIKPILDIHLKLSGARK